MPRTKRYGSPIQDLHAPNWAPLPPTNSRDLPMADNYRTKRSWNDMEREQVDNPRGIPLTDRELDNFDVWDQKQEAVEGQEPEDFNLKGDTKDELDEAQEQLKLDMILMLEQEGKAEAEDESNRLFERSKEAAAVLTEGALVKSTVQNYKR